MAEGNVIQKSVPKNSDDVRPQRGYYDAETATKCREVSTQQDEFYKDLENRWEERRKAQLNTLEKLSVFKTTLDPKVQNHLISFDRSD